MIILSPLKEEEIATSTGNIAVALTRQCLDLSPLWPPQQSDSPTRHPPPAELQRQLPRHRQASPRLPQQSRRLYLSGKLAGRLPGPMRQCRRLGCGGYSRRRLRPGDGFLGFPSRSWGVAPGSRTPRGCCLRRARRARFHLQGKSPAFNPKIIGRNQQLPLFRSKEGCI
jgi:hypothetical protein